MKITIWAVLISAGCIASSVGQTIAPVPSPDQQELYHAVPPDDRQSLRQSIEKFIALEKSAQWEEVYAMLKNEEHQTKDDFLKQNRHASRLVTFTPMKVTYIPPSDFWWMTGCAVFDPPPNHEPGVFSGLRAYKSKGSWLFEEVAIEIMKDEPGGMRRCTAEPTPARK